MAKPASPNQGGSLLPRPRKWPISGLSVYNWPGNVLELANALSEKGNPKKLTGGILLVNRRRSIRMDQQHCVSFTAGCFHPRRAQRHTGNRQAYGLRPLLQQALDLGCRNVPFDGVSLHDRRVTG